MSEVCLASMLGLNNNKIANYVGCAAGVKKSECNYIVNIKSAQWNLVYGNKKRKRKIKKTKAKTKTHTK